MADEVFTVVDESADPGATGTAATFTVGFVDVGPEGPQGPPGDPGQDGADGPPGVDGESAYELAVDAGFSGTLNEWLASLVGAKGDQGDPGGDGAPGSDGADGSPGADGRGITSVARTSGTGAAGTTDTYTITYSDSTTSTFQVVNGADGSDGSPGSDGADGATGPQGPAGLVLPDLGVVALTTFDNTEMQVQVDTSSDGGKTFTNLARRTKYADPDGTIGVRDASIVQFAGQFLIAYTRANLANYLGVNTTTWGLATSQDLLTFTEVAIITPSSPSSITDLWAPDLMVDGDTIYAYMSIRTSSSGGNFQAYVSSAHASDLTSWSTPSLISGLGSNVIDLTVRPNGDEYLAAVKNEDTQRIHKATASSPAGPFTLDATRLPTANESVEGPALLELPQGGWRVYYDAYGADALRYIESTDLTTWSSPVNLSMPASNLRHPSVLWLSHAELAGLRALWTRVESVDNGTGISLDNTDPFNPVVSVDTTSEAERIRDVIAAALVAGTNVTITPNDGADTITISASGGGGGASDAADVTFDPTGLDNTTATDVQNALEDFDAAITTGGGGSSGGVVLLAPGAAPDGSTPTGSVLYRKLGTPAQVTAGHTPAVLVEMDETTGSTFADTSGNGVALTVGSGATLGASPVAPDTGKAASGDGLHAIGSSTASASGLATNCTMMCWVRIPAGAVSYKGGFIKVGGTGNGWTLSIGAAGNSSTNGANLNVGCNGQAWHDTGFVFTPGTYHLAGVKVGNSFSVYVNGVLQLAPTTYTNTNATSGYYIGQEETTFLSSGIAVDHCSWHAAALTASQIATEARVSTGKPLGWWDGSTIQMLDG